MRRSKRLRPIRPAPALKERTRRLTTRIVRAWSAAIQSTILPAYARARRSQARDSMVAYDARNPIGGALSGARRATGKERKATEADLRKWGVETEQWHRNAWGEAVREGVGVDLGRVMSANDVSDELRTAVEWHASLIVDLDEEAYKRVERAVWDAFLDGKSVEKLADELQEMLDISERRATLIARDQLAKLTNKLNEVRQRQAGLDKFVWRHSGKVNYREEHLERDGEIYSWDDPPEDLPGFLINCGCTAEGFLEIKDDEE